uniref:Putative WW-binding domain-containing protein n=1 Tax=Coturnix japonica TaxID=93934 RepID=A0A8C2T806_COTJA
MAKRRAEPLVCYAPFKRLLREPPLRSALSERRPRNEAAGAGSAAKRKLEEAEAPPGKRPGLRGGSPRGEQGDAAGRRRRRSEPAASQNERTAEGSDGRRGEEPAAAPVTARGQEEFNQYNSFFYWRAPLPTIDLSDIQSLHEETTSANKTPSRTDTMETEMET